MKKAAEILRVLAVGDVVGRPGQDACVSTFKYFLREQEIDVTIANVENLAGGSGITEQTTRPLFESGVDVMTTGDHVFKKKEAETLLVENRLILRPANYPPQTPGFGSTVIEKKGVRIGVINIMGRVFLKTVDCPFEAARKEIEKLRRETRIILVDFHAEATSEKMAMAWFLDGKVSGLFGTHTHVQTADEQILPLGTGYITDTGMCGPYRSVIGREIEDSLKLFLTQMPVRLNVATEDARISGVIFDVDRTTGKTVAIRRVHEKVRNEIPV